MTILELMKELGGEDTGWCLCHDPMLNLNRHLEERLVEKIIVRLIDRCEKAMVDVLHENDVVDMRDAEGSNAKWIKEEFRKKVLPALA